jgi:hypothetical protein
MAPTTSFNDAKKFAGAIQSAGGTVPTVLANLLTSHELLSAPAATQAPEADILTHALAGSLDRKTLAKLAPIAATADMVNGYLRELARNSEHTLLGEWHRQVKAGGADAILDSLRPNFDKHASAIAKARSLIDPQSSAEQILANGAPELVQAWQQLDEHIRAITQIAAVASQFGPRTGNFPQITEYPLGQGGRLDDRAIMCTAGSLVTDSGLFQRPDQGHRTSPWFRTTLRLHTIAEARERYREWASAEWEEVNSGPRGGWIDSDGRMHEHPAPKNPFKREVPV